MGYLWVSRKYRTFLKQNYWGVVLGVFGLELGDIIEFLDKNR